MASKEDTVTVASLNEMALGEGIGAFLCGLQCDSLIVLSRKACMFSHTFQPLMPA